MTRDEEEFRAWEAGKRAAIMGNGADGAYRRGSRLAVEHARGYAFGLAKVAELGADAAAARYY